MRWPWQRQPVTDVRAVEAVAVADVQLTAQRRLTPAVEQLAEQLDERRHRNRFAELLEDALLRRQT